MFQRSNPHGPVITSWQAKAILGAAGLCLAGAAAVAAVLKGNYQIIEKGQLLSYTSGYIYRVKFFESFELYLEPEWPRVTDYIAAGFLSGIAAISLAFAMILLRWGGAVQRRPFLMFLLLAPSAAFLSIDETIGIHENLGHNLQFLMELPFVKHPDDAIMVSYAIPFLLFAACFWREVVAARAALIAMAMAGAFFGLAATSDLLGARLEEIFEILSGGAMAASVLLLGMHHVAALLQPRLQAPATGAPGSQ